MSEFWQDYAWQGFEHPWVLLLLLAWPFWLGWHLWRGGLTDWQASLVSAKTVFYHPLLSRFLQQAMPAPKKALSVTVKGLGHGLRWLLLLLLILGLANPYRTEILPPEPPKQTVRDIVLVVESSVSFLLPDYLVNGQPQSRMTVVKSVLDQFMAQLAGNRFGLILYADEAYRLMPLTADKEVARLMLQKLQPYLAGRNDVAMGEAIGLGLDVPDEGTLSGATRIPESTQNRLMVVISDGLSGASRLPLQEVIEYAQAKSMPIYTLGIGAGDASADQRQFAGLLYQPLEEKSLQQLAEQTGGLYYRVGSGEDLAAMLSKIDQREGALLQTQPERERKVSLRPAVLQALVWSFVLYGVFLIWIRRADNV